MPPSSSSRRPWYEPPLDQSTYGPWYRPPDLLGRIAIRLMRLTGWFRRRLRIRLSGLPRPR